MLWNYSRTHPHDEVCFAGGRGAGSACADGQAASFTRGGADYEAFTVAPDLLAAIIDGLQLVVMPLANPDGHDFTLTELPAGTTP